MRAPAMQSMLGNAALRERRSDSAHPPHDRRQKVDDYEIESHDLEPLYNSIVKYEKVRRSKDRKCYGYSGATLSKNITTVLIGALTAVIAYGLSVCVVRGDTPTDPAARPARAERSRRPDARSRCVRVAMRGGERSAPDPRRAPSACASRARSPSC